jgi:hypothetical protein
MRQFLRHTLIFYLCCTNALLLLSETGTAIEEVIKKQGYGPDKLNDSQLRRSSIHQTLLKSGEEKLKLSETDSKIDGIDGFSHGLRSLNKKKSHHYHDYSDNSSSSQNSDCEVCPTEDGPFRKRKYHFYILHDVTNVGLYDFFGGSSTSKEPMENFVPAGNVVTPIPPATSAPVLAPGTSLAPTTVSPATQAPLVTPGATLAPTTLAPTTSAPLVTPGTTAAPTTLAPTTSAPTTLAPTTLAPTTLAPASLAPTTSAPVARLAPIAASERSFAAERPSLWQWISGILSRFY